MSDLTVTSLGEAITEKVRKVLFDSIPDSVVDGMIKKELENFCNQRDRYSHEGRSKLEHILHTEISKQLTDQLTEKVGAMVKDKIGENQTIEALDAYHAKVAPLIMASVCTNFANMATQNLRNELQNKGIYL